MRLGHAAETLSLFLFIRAWVSQMNKRGSRRNERNFFVIIRSRLHGMALERMRIRMRAFGLLQRQLNRCTRLWFYVMFIFYAIRFLVGFCMRLNRRLHAFNSFQSNFMLVLCAFLSFLSFHLTINGIDCGQMHVCGLDEHKRQMRIRAQSSTIQTELVAASVVTRALAHTKSRDKSRERKES